MDKMMERNFGKYINFELERVAFNEFGGKASISVDFSDNMIITDCGTMRDYESDTIVTVVFKDDFQKQKIITRSRLFNLLEAMQAKYNDGWKRADFEQYGEYEFAEYHL